MYNRLFLEQYTITHKEEYPQLENPGGSATVTLKKLRDQGYLNQHLENPKTGQDFLDTDYVSITINNDYTRNYQFNK